MKNNFTSRAAIGFLMIASILTLFVFASTNGTIKGHIKDKITHEPIAYAKIAVIGKGIPGGKNGTTDAYGNFIFTALAPGKYDIEVSTVGYTKKIVTSVLVESGKTTFLKIEMESSPELKYVETISIPESQIRNNKRSVPSKKEDNTSYDIAAPTSTGSFFIQAETDFNTEQYDYLPENEFHDAIRTPLSTFSIDVDPASYANMRRFITSGSLPPIDAIRIEELVNYFKYDYPQPKNEDPFTITTEATICPWNKTHQLVSIGLQGKTISTTDLPPSNLVFLLDVSGSMMSNDKLPLLKKALALLTDQLRDEDRVAIVVYAGNAGLVLPSTSGSNKAAILEALESLQAGGSTAGGAGIQLAYQIAKENLLINGNNRVILATDGDFNVGMSSDGELVRLIEEKRNQGIFLTVLGFGTGNLKDSKMEKLADKGNGNYAYIDNILEAKKVLVTEMGGTLFTIAKDVKLQVEFNPEFVKTYKLIGYENRLLKDQDFNDDKKDAGELGSGHTVTALYEIVPVSSNENFITIDPLRYQQPATAKISGEELFTVKLRYKDPQSETSKLITKNVKFKTTPFINGSINHRFAASVAAFGLILRDSKFKGDANFDLVLKTAKASKGNDSEGFRAEFIRIIELAELLKKNN